MGVSWNFQDLEIMKKKQKVGTQKRDGSCCRNVDDLVLSEKKEPTLTNLLTQNQKGLRKKQRRMRLCLLRSWKALFFLFIVVSKKHDHHSFHDESIFFFQIIQN